MKTILSTTAILFFCLSFGQSKKILSQKQIENKIKKSYYIQKIPIDIKFYTKKYLCLQDKYNLDISKEKALLTKKEFESKYPNYDFKSDNDIENRSIIQESEQKMNFDINKKSTTFPKCFKYSEFFKD